MEVDARGKECPKPVLMTRDALNNGETSFCVLVDNEVARNNVQRFAEKAGCEVGVKETEFGYQLDIATGVAVDLESGRRGRLNKVLFITTDRLGKGDEDLGNTLMKAFLYTCTENTDRPNTIVMMNSGVRLATENEETIGHLESLVNQGCELLVCGTCLDYYGLREQLAVGRVSNMYEIQSTLIAADRLISL